ncbi:Os07g0552066 [Oryza sativa Japonica Group]|uniref:Os07g0552066 protein n=1 Tax=Oryza sativa subsp. japonica TaxID=39947 RepID=A0A0P0X7C5_ORYSJ|nr:Os07g0552066 [Oryza sativa Japonica Group]
MDGKARAASVSAADEVRFRVDESGAAPEGTKCDVQPAATMMQRGFERTRRRTDGGDGACDSCLHGQWRRRASTTTTGCGGTTARFRVSQRLLEMGQMGFLWLAVVAAC